MMLTFTKNNCITEAIISPDPIFVSGLLIVAKSHDSHGDIIYVIPLSPQHIWQSLKSILQVELEVHLYLVSVNCILVIWSPL